MSEIRRVLRLARNGQFLLVATIFLLSLLTFNILFEASSPDEYPRELLAALIGTILAAVVTTLLLNQQSAGEELKERNVEVFRKKIAAYETFIDRALLHAEDDSLSDDEVRELRRAIYSMSLVSSADTVGVLISYVRANHVGDTECDIAEVVAAFRQELKLDELDAATLINLEAVEAKLSGNLDQQVVSEALNRLNAVADTIMDRFRSKFPKIAAGASKEDAYGEQNGATVYIACESGLTCYLMLNYGRPLLVGFFEFSELAPKMRRAINQQADNLRLDANDDSPDTRFFTLSD